MAGTTACTIGHWGKEVASTTYNLLDTNKAYEWISSPPAVVVDNNMVKAGFAGGEDMYVCRGTLTETGETYLGKAASSWDACLAGKDGKEIALKPFEFLSVKDAR